MPSVQFVMSTCATIEVKSSVKCPVQCQMFLLKWTCDVMYTCVYMYIHVLTFIYYVSDMSYMCNMCDAFA